MDTIPLETMIDLIVKTHLKTDVFLAAHGEEYVRIQYENALQNGTITEPMIRDKFNEQLEFIRTHNPDLEI